MADVVVPPIVGEGGFGRHRGERVDDGIDHCCFGGCSTRLCPTCLQSVCSNAPIHSCRPPYEGRHRARMVWMPIFGYVRYEVFDEIFPLFTTTRGAIEYRRDR